MLLKLLVSMGIKKRQIEVNAWRITHGAYFLRSESHWAFGVPVYVSPPPSSPPTSTSVCFRGAVSDAGALEYLGGPSVAGGAGAFTLIEDEFASSGSWGLTVVGGKELSAIGESITYGFDVAPCGYWFCGKA